MSNDRRTSNGASPFDLPAMADAYPLDDSEREAVHGVLHELERERAAAPDLQEREPARES